MFVMDSPAPQQNSTFSLATSEHQGIHLDNGTWRKHNSLVVHKLRRRTYFRHTVFIEDIYLRYKVATHDWSKLLLCTDIQVVYDIFLCEVHKLINEHAGHDDHHWST